MRHKFLFVVALAILAIVTLRLKERWGAWPQDNVRVFGPPSVAAPARALQAARGMPAPFEVFPVDGCELTEPIRQDLLRRIAWSAGQKGLGFEPVTVHTLRLLELARRGSLPVEALAVFERTFELLTDDREFRLVESRFPLIVDTSFGAAYRTYPKGMNPGLEKEMIGGMTHVDKVLSVMGELGIPLEQEIVSSSGRTFCIADVLEDSMQRFSPARELEWTFIAYCDYLGPQREWTNARGDLCSIDTMLIQLLSKNEASGACFGTHRLYALMKARMRERRTPGYFRAETIRALDSYLASVNSRLEKCQAREGHWDDRWCDNGSDGTDRVGATDQITEAERRLTVTSHMLEWCAIAAPGLRLRDACIVRAAEFVRAQLHENPDLYFGRGFTYSTHAVRALLLLAPSVASEGTENAWAGESASSAEHE